MIAWPHPVAAATLYPASGVRGQFLHERTLSCRYRLPRRAGRSRGIGVTTEDRSSEAPLASNGDHRSQHLRSDAAYCRSFAKLGQASRSCRRSTSRHASRDKTLIAILSASQASRTELVARGFRDQKAPSCLLPLSEEMFRGKGAHRRCSIASHRFMRPGNIRQVIGYRRFVFRRLDAFPEPSARGRSCACGPQCRMIMPQSQ
jgi:hypothetical protein